jgi:hypothetical protein
MNQSSNDNQQVFKASGGAKHSVGTASKTYADVASTPAKKSPSSSVGSKKAAAPFAAGSKKPPVPVKKSPSSSRSLLIQHQD